MRRVYTGIANFRAPYDDGGLTLTGLGAAWPQGRSYHDVSNYLAPYDTGYFQANALFGLGGVQRLPETEVRMLPPKVQRYVRAGEPVGTVRRDLAAASAQVPRWVWGIGAALALYLAYRSYQQHQKRPAKKVTTVEYTGAERQLTANRKRRSYRRNRSRR
jgi:hypothetical protein